MMGNLALTVNRASGSRTCRSLALCLPASSADGQLKKVSCKKSELSASASA
jgi:hypothetical protein